MLNFPAKNTYSGRHWFWWVPLLVVADQSTKFLVINLLHHGEVVKVLPGLQIVYARNYGIAFSWFSQQSGYGRLVLLGIILTISLFVGRWLVNTPLTERWNGVALVAIFGGALGNLFDRLYHGYVIDFIDFYYKGWHWYTFNMADIFITLGACMLAKTILYAKE